MAEEDATKLSIDAAVPRKEPVLSWLAILPVVIFIAIEVKYGLPRARNHATSPDLAPAYLMGEVIAALGGSLAFAWIAYRAARRSCRVGTSVFILTLAHFSYANYRLPAARVVVLPRPTTRTFPMAGFSVTAARGWQEVSPDSPKRVVQWARFDLNTGAVGAMVVIEAGKPKESDAREIARGLAGDWKGKFTDSQLSLDGEPAYQVTAKAAGNALAPVEGLVAIHRGVMYLIVGVETPGHSCQNQIDAVRTSWKWIPIETPLKHLQFRDKPLAALGNTLSINFPSAMYFNEVNATPPRLELQFYNPSRGGNDLDIVVQSGDIPAGSSMDVMKQRLSAGSASRFKLATSFQWKELKGPSERYIANAVGAEIEGRKIWIGWALVRLDGNVFALINFTINPQDPEERRRYETLVERIVQTADPPTQSAPR